MESDRQAESLEDFTMDGMQRMVEYMYEHLEEFRLLVNAAHGTKFQNFVEHLVEIETDYTYKFMESVGLDPTKRKHITKDFMHIMNKALFESFFDEILLIAQSEMPAAIQYRVLFFIKSWPKKDKMKIKKCLAGPDLSSKPEKIKSISEKQHSVMATGGT